MAIDLYQNFVSAQYLEIKWTEFDQTLHMFLYKQYQDWDCYRLFFAFW